MTLVRPEELELAADIAVAALQPAIGQDWSTKAGRLEWSVDFTIAHMAAGAAKSAVYLASRSTRFIAVRLGRWPDATQAEQLEAITGAAQALANVARTSPKEARAFHTTGMLDAEGYVTKACIEMLVHAYDVACGLNLPFMPPDELCEPIVARAFPWLNDSAPASQVLLWQTGRLDLPDTPSNDDSWCGVFVPLTEWDGSVPKRDPRPVVEWVLNQSGWEPRYVEEGEATGS